MITTGDGGGDWRYIWSPLLEMRVYMITTSRDGGDRLKVYMITTGDWGYIPSISKQRRTPWLGSEKGGIQGGIESYRAVLQTIHSQGSGRQHCPKTITQPESPRPKGGTEPRRTIVRTMASRSRSRECVCVCVCVCKHPHMRWWREEKCSEARSGMLVLQSQ